MSERRSTEHESESEDTDRESDISVTETTKQTLSQTSESTQTSVPRSAIDQARHIAATADRVVVKAGTNSLTDSTSNLDDEKLDKLVDDIADLIEHDKEVILVSSGAIGAGKGRAGYAADDTVEESQALSTIGQSHLMRRYTESFERYGLTVAQILITDHDLEDMERFTNFKNTIETLLSWDVIPIINENDAVATEEIRIGDNDMLSSSLAIGVESDLLVILTDVGGVYTGNPKENTNATRINAVGANYDEVESIIAVSSESKFGGIQTKVRGARAVSEHGIPAIIARSTESDVLQRIATEISVGTIFVPVDNQTKTDSD
ncbi:glutamate 5-kinase [Haloquadratum walsbyi]|mgnify:FL=1|jgi:glutamate 5-kinase|uniref:Glutamate 5-kinase n=2 Tax=Haloquadratum walsbyi TaxID=293091 RepID=G0LKE0_HALWC|nr:glutamate 5-kinase [Haloquadratum walsbyi]CCC39898.1 glutamate 5-kinase [Haloquadratum walsbyi C23]